MSWVLLYRPKGPDAEEVQLAEWKLYPSAKKLRQIKELNHHVFSIGAINYLRRRNTYITDIQGGKFRLVSTKEPRK